MTNDHIWRKAFELGEQKSPTNTTFRDRADYSSKRAKRKKSAAENKHYKGAWNNRVYCLTRTIKIHKLPNLNSLSTKATQTHQTIEGVMKTLEEGNTAR